jgi:hypothetical protein
VAGRRAHIALRRLYHEFASAGLHLEQWLITERLELARAQPSEAPWATSSGMASSVAVSEPW